MTWSVRALHTREALRRYALGIALGPAALLGLLGCDNGDGPAAPPADASPDCGNSAATITIRLAQSSEPLASLVTNLGYRVDLTALYAVSAMLEWMPCPEETGWLDTLRPWSIATAHVLPTPTRLGGAPRVLELVGNVGGSDTWGTLTPPLGRYCEVRFGTSPADPDAPGLPTAVDIVGKSLLVTGSVTPPGGGEAVSLDLSSTLSTRVDHPLAAPLDLQCDTPHNVTVTLHPERWFDDVDFLRLDPSQLDQQVVFNLRSTTEITVD